MSAPTPAPGDDRPREGYYPDPSIPGYVRYWNGASWVPGTSRPAPTDGVPLAPPTGPAGPAAPVEETGPHFFDEDPVGPPGQSGPPGHSGGAGPSSAAVAQHGGRPEPAAAWGADRTRQSGFGGDQDRRVSWGSPQGAPQGAQQPGQPGAPQGGQHGVPQGADPRVPRAAEPADGPPRPEGRSGRTDGTATIPPAEPDEAAAGGTFVFRRPTAGPGGAAGGAGTATPGVPGPGGPVDDEGTVTFRALSPRAAQQNGAAGAHQGSTGAPGTGSDHAPGAAPGAFGAQFSQPGIGAQAASPEAAASSGATPAPGTPGTPGFGAGKAAAARAATTQGQAGAGTAAQAASGAPGALSGPQQATPQVAPSGPQQPSVPQQGGPMAAGVGGGQPSWAQQVHRLAGASDDEQPVAPWKPPVDDVFQAAARRQSSARPAGLGKRLAARLVDTVVLAAVTAVAAVPLGTKALDHVNEKIDAAKLSGETVTVWLLDGTTSVYLGIILAVLLVFGVLYEALPTAKWGRTLGKKLFGLDVRDIEGGTAPSFGAALRRWLVYSVPGLLAVGVLGVLWGLFDRPWRQCWHDKAAHTFVAG